MLTITYLYKKIKMNTQIKIYSIFTLLLLSGSLTAQIAINRASAGTNAVYIEGGNTAVATDDVIITNTGSVGVGCIPQNKLDINGSMIYSYGSPEKDQVLVSDALGFASWTFMSFASKIGEWQLTNSTGTLFNDRVLTALTGTSKVLAGDEIGLTASTNSVIIPKGRYLMFISGDLAGYEYGCFSTSTGYMVYYGVTLNGTASYLNVNVPTTLTMAFSAISPGIKRTDGAYFYLHPPYTVPYSFRVRFLMLD